MFHSVFTCRSLACKSIEKIEGEAVMRVYGTGLFDLYAKYLADFREEGSRVLDYFRW